MSTNKPIVMTTDLSELSWAAMGPAAQLADRFDTKLIAVAFIPVLSKLSLVSFAGHAMETFAKIEEEEIEATKERLDNKLTRLPGIETEGHALLDDDVPGGIIRFANEQDARVIVMATHGRTGVAHALLGSTTEKVMRCSEIPVLIVPAGARGRG